MALIRGCHVIAKGNHAEALEIIPKILAHGLLIHTARIGTAAYAYYIHMVPAYRRHEPMVVFEVDERYVENKPAPIPHKLPTYAFMKMYAPGLTYIPIHVLGFVNVSEPLLPIYNGPIGFF
ncbi:MAG: hypothetical protein FJ147_18985 [Deltaproteobacteria bacterium]|nr:hypothetical protein [Deltaproteobacteria bacterium]